MIEYKPRFLTRNEEIVAELRESVGAAAPLDPMVVLKRKVAEVSTLMALLQGGDWRVDLAPEKGFLLIARRGRRSK